MQKEEDNSDDADIEVPVQRLSKKEKKRLKRLQRRRLIPKRSFARASAAFDRVAATIVEEAKSEHRDVFEREALGQLIKEEQEAAKAQHQSAQKAPSHAESPPGAAAVPYINFDASVADLRKPATQRNWMLCALIK